MIQLKGVTKIYGSKEVLCGVNLNLERGRTHVLWGSSGSGKTTLVRLLCGLIDSSSGEVLIDGKVVSSATQSYLKEKIGYLVQEGALFPHLTARENISLTCLSLDWSPEKLTARINELAQLVQIDQSTLDRIPRNLSGGQRQRVALMRALMLNPEIIILDEPLSALDPIVRADLQRELKVIFNSLKKTVIIVTHDIGEGAFFGHTLSLFDKGRLIQHGEFQSFVSHPQSEFVSRFIKAQLPIPELLESLK